MPKMGKMALMFFLLPSSYSFLRAFCIGLFFGVISNKFPFFPLINFFLPPFEATREISCLLQQEIKRTVSCPPSPAID